MKHPRAVAVVVTLVCIVLLAVLGGIVTVQIQNTGTDAGYEKYFNPDEVTRVDITIDKDYFEKMLNTAPKTYTVATVALNGDVYDNVGIKLRGASSFNHVKDSKTSNRFSFSVKADKFVKHNSFAGLDKFVLSGNNADATMMKEFLTYEILKKSGVKTPLHSYAAIYINGEYWGFYHMVEGVDKSFIKRNYGVQEGVIYKPEGKFGIMTPEGYVADTSIPHHGGHLEYAGDNVETYDELFSHQNALTDSAGSSGRMLSIIRDLDERKNLDKILTIDEIIPYFAVNAVVSNLDSYFSAEDTHNFFIYENDGKITIFPWDNDYAFGFYHLGETDSVNLPIDTPFYKHWKNMKSEEYYKERPLFAAIVENPEYHQKYLDSVRYITENYLGDSLIKKIDELSVMIRPYMEADPNVAYPVDKYFDNAVATLKKFIQLRKESILGQLEGKIPTTFLEQELHPETLVDPGDLDLTAMGCGSLFDRIWS